MEYLKEAKLKPDKRCDCSRVLELSVQGQELYVYVRSRCRKRGGDAYIVHSTLDSKKNNKKTNKNTKIKTRPKGRNDGSFHASRFSPYIHTSRHLLVRLSWMWYRRVCIVPCLVHKPIKVSCPMGLDALLYDHVTWQGCDGYSSMYRMYPAGQLIITTVIFLIAHS